MNYFKLLERFEDLDTTMTTEEVLALMIGTTIQPDYKPYMYVSRERALVYKSLDDNFQSAFDSCNAILSKHPLNFTALMGRDITARKLNDLKSEQYRIMFLKVVDVIFYTGDGSIEHPFMVLGPIDGQWIIPFFLGEELVLWVLAQTKMAISLICWRCTLKDGNL